MKNMAAYVANTIHKILTRPEPSVVMLVETDVYAYGM